MKIKDNHKKQIIAILQTVLLITVGTTQVLKPEPAVKVELRVNTSCEKGKVKKPEVVIKA